MWMWMWRGAKILVSRMVKIDSSVWNQRLFQLECRYQREIPVGAKSRRLRVAIIDTFSLACSQTKKEWRFNIYIQKNVFYHTMEDGVVGYRRNIDGCRRVYPKEN